jgi:hypothetical protein
MSTIALISVGMIKFIHWLTFSSGFFKIFILELFLISVRIFSHQYDVCYFIFIWFKYNQIWMRREKEKRVVHILYPWEPFYSIPPIKSALSSHIIRHSFVLSHHVTFCCNIYFFIRHVYNNLSMFCYYNFVESKKNKRPSHDDGFFSPRSSFFFLYI